jgi:glycosyltransferase involved in cell wall biosynthesis
MGDCGPVTIPPGLDKHDFVTGIEHGPDEPKGANLTTAGGRGDWTRMEPKDAGHATSAEREGLSWSAQLERYSWTTTRTTYAVLEGSWPSHPNPGLDACAMIEPSDRECPGPDVVVAVPVFNGAAYLEAALSSALTQTVPARRVVVFDNCSTDNTVDIARALLPAGDIREAAKNAGAAVNFTRAVRETEGTYFQWLGADDRLLPGYIERCLAALASAPSAPAALAGVRYIDPSGRGLREQCFTALGLPEPGPRLRSFLRQPRWTEVYALYRREALEPSPLFRSEYATDVLLIWWFLLRGPFAVADEVLWEYREYPEKTVAQMARGLNPDASDIQWRKVRLWHRLWQETSVPGVLPSVRRTARRELMLAILGGAWRMHLAEDLLLWVDRRAPRLARTATRLARSRSEKSG